MKSRIKLSAILILISLGASVCTGLLFCAVAGDVEKSFLDKWTWFSGAIFVMFGGGSFVAAILLLITTLPDDLVFGFWNGLYYGTVFGEAAIYKIIGTEVSEPICYAFSFVVTSLICYIVWLKEFKRRYDK